MFTHRREILPQKTDKAHGNMHLGCTARYGEDRHIVYKRLLLTYPGIQQERFVTSKALQIHDHLINVVLVHTKVVSAYLKRFPFAVDNDDRSRARFVSNLNVWQ